MIPEKHKVDYEAVLKESEENNDSKKGPIKRFIDLIKNGKKMKESQKKF